MGIVVLLLGGKVAGGGKGGVEVGGGGVDLGCGGRHGCAGRVFDVPTALTDEGGGGVAGGNTWNGWWRWWSGGVARCRWSGSVSNGSSVEKVRVEVEQSVVVGVKVNLQQVQLLAPVLVPSVGCIQSTELEQQDTWGFSGYDCVTEDTRVVQGLGEGDEELEELRRLLRVSQARRLLLVRLRDLLTCLPRCTVRW